MSCMFQVNSTVQILQFNSCWVRYVSMLANADVYLNDIRGHTSDCVVSFNPQAYPATSNAAPSRGKVGSLVAGIMICPSRNRIRVVSTITDRTEILGQKTLL